MKFTNCVRATVFAMVAGIALLTSCPTKVGAQSANTSPITSLLDQKLIPLNTPFSLGSQTFIALTNQTGGYTFISYGQAGSITNTPPTTISGAMDQGAQMVANNNPSLTNYFTTNEMVASFGAVYV